MRNVTIHSRRFWHYLSEVKDGTSASRESSSELYRLFARWALMPVNIRSDEKGCSPHEGAAPGRRYSAPDQHNIPKYGFNKPYKRVAVNSLVTVGRWHSVIRPRNFSAITKPNVHSTVSYSGPAESTSRLVPVRSVQSAVLLFLYCLMRVHSEYKLRSNAS